jgi:hypothetical protein
LAELQEELKEFIDSPDVFIARLHDTELNIRKRHLEIGNEWHTRFMSVTHNNVKRAVPPLLETVRTHLK